MLAFLLALIAAPPSPEAEQLGRRLAATGALETLLRVVAEKETAELAAQHPELSAAERTLLTQTGQQVAAGIREKIVAALGAEYAGALGIEDLRALVAFAETPAARRFREAMPGATLRALPRIGGVDFGGELRRSFCAKTGKLCKP